MTLAEKTNVSSSGEPDHSEPVDEIGVPARIMFDAASNGLLLTDLSGTITRANPNLEKMFGYERGELNGQSVEILIPHRHRAAHVKQRLDYARAPETRDMGVERDLTGRRKDGLEFPVEIALNAVESGDTHLICASVIDVTERRRNELRLRESNAQLEEFTYVASHDLRSPIRAIANLLTFIEEDFDGEIPDPVQRHLDRARDRTRQMEQLIDDLLVYARSGRRDGVAEPVDLRALVDEAIKLAIPNDTLDVRVDVVDEPLNTMRTPLLTVLRNLISNAHKHHDKAERRIEVKVRFDGSYCLFDIIDDGPGISTAFQERMFRLFQTSSSSQRDGAGLGLAVVRRLVDAHGANITVISDTEERGCHFRVWWPRFKRSDIDD